MIDIQENISLAMYSTMRLGGRARFLTEIQTADQVIEALQFAQSQELKHIVIGCGSNIVWQDSGFDGLVIVNHIVGKRIEGNKLVVAAGENWDEAVAYSVENGLSGLEFLSLIPGSAGATPVQNVGAYGSEISHSLIELSAIDTTTNKIVCLQNQDCEFAYRSSIFKTSQKNRYIILELTFGLSRQEPRPPFYPALQDYLNAKSIRTPSALEIRQAVIAIRSSKLPDPAKVANNGSFFANPIVSRTKAEALKAEFPTMPSWPVDDNNVKLSAAWLIDQAGLKDFHDPKTGMATWASQPLVLVNEKAKSTSDLLLFRDRIVDTVRHKFDVHLVQEPELVP